MAITQEFKEKIRERLEFKKLKIKMSALYSVKPELQKRNIRIAIKRCHGAKLKEIAAEEKLRSERIRQIHARYCRSMTNIVCHPVFGNCLDAVDFFEMPMSEIVNKKHWKHPKMLILLKAYSRLIDEE